MGCRSRFALDADAEALVRRHLVFFDGALDGFLRRTAGDLERQALAPALQQVDAPTRRDDFCAGQQANTHRSEEKIAIDPMHP
jgi:hypothetical protein